MEQILTILGSVGFNWHVALANFFNFLIILFLLNKFFFKKIGKTISDRHRVIEEGLNKASEGERILHTAHEEKEKIIKEAHVKESRILEESELKAKEKAKSIEEGAQADLRAKYVALEKEEAELAQKVEKEFSEKAPSIVAKLYEKTLLRTMTEEENNALIGNMVK